MVRRARRRDRPLGKVQDRRLLYTLGRQAAGVRGQVRLPAAASYAALLEDRTIEAIINTTPNNVHLETTRAGRASRQARLPRQADRQHDRGRARAHAACREAGVVLALGYQRRKESQFRWIRRKIDEGAFGRLVNAEANISRDRLVRST